MKKLKSHRHFPVWGYTIWKRFIIAHQAKLNYPQNMQGKQQKCVNCGVLIFPKRAAQIAATLSFILSGALTVFVFHFIYNPEQFPLVPFIAAAFTFAVFSDLLPTFLFTAIPWIDCSNASSEEKKVYNKCSDFFSGNLALAIAFSLMILSYIIAPIL